MKVAFFGTPEFAVASLEAVAAEHEIVVVVAQPDRPSGRGMKMQAPPVAVRARALGLPLMQPSKIRTEEFLASIRDLQPDAGIVVAYGRILPKALLEIPPLGFLNVHGSILPKYRGAAPMQRAIEAGEITTGVSIMRVDEELDHGPVFRIDTLAIGADERAPSVSRRLSQLGGGALTNVLYEVARGTATETVQDHARATHAPKIEKAEGQIRWSEASHVIYNRYRAFDPWPGAFFEFHGETIKVPEMHLSAAAGAPGTILEIDRSSVTVATASGAIELHELQRPGKSRAAAADVARGLGWTVGAVLS